VTSYEVFASPGVLSVPGTSSPIAVMASQLDPGVAYTFQVTATNQYGVSLPSVGTVAVTPGCENTCYGEGMCAFDYNLEQPRCFEYAGNGGSFPCNPNTTPSSTQHEANGGIVANPTSMSEASTGGNKDTMRGSVKPTSQPSIAPSPAIVTKPSTSSSSSKAPQLEKPDCGGGYYSGDFQTQQSGLIPSPEVQPVEVDTGPCRSDEVCCLALEFTMQNVHPFFSQELEKADHHQYYTSSGAHEAVETLLKADFFSAFETADAVEASISKEEPGDEDCKITVILQTSKIRGLSEDFEGQWQNPASLVHQGIISKSFSLTDLSHLKVTPGAIKVSSRNQSKVLWTQIFLFPAALLVGCVLVYFFYSYKKHMQKQRLQTYAALNRSEDGSLETGNEFVIGVNGEVKRASKTTNRMHKIIEDLNEDNDKGR